MSRPAAAPLPVDRLLLLVVMPVWLLAFGLHVREGLRSGLAQPGFFVSRVASGPHPVVRGFRLEQMREAGAVREGDVLLRVGAVDLRGVGNIGFDALAIAEAGASGEAPLVYRRGSSTGETQLRLVGGEGWWVRIPAQVAGALAAFLVLLRGGGTPGARLFFCAFMAFVLSQTPFHGGPPVQTAASKLLFYGLGSLAPALLVLWAVAFPPEAARLRSWLRRLPWLLVPLYVFLRAHFFVEGPLPGRAVPALVTTTDGLVFLALLAALTRGYRRSDAVGRRRVKWVLWGFWVALLPATATAIALTLLPPAPWHVWVLRSGLFATVAAPLGILIAILRYQLFDIDRVISGTASLSVLLVVALAAVVTVVPEIARAAGDALGVDPAASRLGLSVAIALGAVPVQRRLRPYMDAWLFPERRTLEESFRELVLALSTCEDPDALAECVGAGLDRVLRPETVAIHELRDGQFIAVFVRGTGMPASLPAEGPLRIALEDEASHSVLAPGDDAMPPGIGEALEAGQLALAAAVHRRGALAWVIGLGARRGGDIYTPTDRVWISALAERCGAELGRFEDARAIAASRALKERLRRYVPDAIAASIEAGRELEAAESDVTVLFVDIRGYTRYAETRRAAEIFSTLSRYTRAVSETVRRFGGTVVEFNGDGMMAVFGAPEPLPAKERAAVDAARSMVAQLRDLGAAAGDEPLAVGVGIATGPAFVGSIAAADRLIWSAVGNTTNLAARLQTLTRDLDAVIAIDDRTWRAAGDAGRGFVRRQAMRIRGRSEPIDVHALALMT
jgi:class 3 adenylate cyclase